MVDFPFFSAWNFKKLLENIQRSVCDDLHGKNKIDGALSEMKVEKFAPFASGVTWLVEN